MKSSYSPFSGQQWYEFNNNNNNNNNNNKSSSSVFRLPILIKEVLQTSSFTRGNWENTELLFCEDSVIYYCAENTWLIKYISNVAGFFLNLNINYLTGSDFSEQNNTNKWLISGPS